MTDESSVEAGGCDKREFTRTTVQIMAEVTVPDRDTVSGPVKDISMSGLLLYANEPLPGGTTCQVAVFLEGGEDPLRLEMEGEVMRAGSGGMAVEFRSIEMDSVDHLHHLILYNASNTDTVEHEFEEHVGLKRIEDA